MKLANGILAIGITLINVSVGQCIISEEREQYLSGSITKDMLIEHLENQIGLYLEEKN